MKKLTPLECLNKFNTRSAFNTTQIIEAMEFYKNQFCASGSEDLFVWDGINNSLEEVDDLDDAESFITENFIENGEIHPDIESVFIVKKIASVHITDTGNSTDMNGDEVPICTVAIY